MPGSRAAHWWPWNSWPIKLAAIAAWRMRVIDVNRGENEPIMADAWTPGETIVGQSVWQGKLRVACPMFVIHDRPDVLAAYIPRGTIVKQARTLGGETVRLPLGEWVLVDDVWTRAAVMLAFPGRRYRLLGFWDDPHERIITWY